MKKRFILSYFLLTLFLFFSFLFMKKEKDKSNVYNLFDFYQSEKVNSIILNKEYKTKDKSDLLRYLETYGKSKDTKFIINNYIFDDKGKVNKIVYYLAADKAYIDNKILYFINKKVDLDKTYLSSVKKDTSDYLYLFTDDIDIEIHDFKDILKEDKLIDSIHYFPTSSSEKENIENYLTSNYAKYIDKFGVSNTELYDIDKELIQTMIYYSIVCFILFLLINIFIISKNLKALSIYRINGFKTKDLILKFFKTNIKIILICSLIFPAIYYLIFIGKIDSRAIKFLLDFYKYIIIFCLLYFISLLVIYNFIRGMSIPMLTKSYNFNYFILKNTIVICLALTIPLSTILNDGLKELVTNKSYEFAELIKINRAYKDVLISSGFKSEKRNLSYDQLDETNLNNEKHIKLYNRFNEAKSVYKYQQGIIFDENKKEYYTTDVNKKLLDDLSLKNNKKDIDLNYEKNSLYLFFNKKEFNKDLWKTYQNDYYDKIFFVVYDEFTDLGFDIFDYSANSYPIISYSTKDNYPIYKTIESNTIFLNTSKEKIENVLSEYDWEDTIILNKGSDLIKEYKKSYLLGLLNLIFMIFPGALISTYIVSTVEKFYFESVKKRWAVLYINGWKKRHALKSFLTISIGFILIMSILQLLVFKEVKIYYNIFLSLIFVIGHLVLLRKYVNIDADMILQGMED